MAPAKYHLVFRHPDGRVVLSELDNYADHVYEVSGEYEFDGLQWRVVEETLGEDEVPTLICER